MEAKYINPFTDFGFKKIFGEEASKPLLMDFLNSLLPPEGQIKQLSFKNTEQLGPIAELRKAVYDIYCENEKGEKFIVELQKAKQNYFKERTIFYSTFPISEQAQKGDWNYDLKAVYCVGVLDFRFDDYTSDEESRQVVHKILLKNQHGKVFYDKLTYIYLEMPNFNKTEEQLSGRLDKWLYFIKHLEDFEQIPRIFNKEEIFIDAFKKAELSKLDRIELKDYQQSLKIYRDLKGVIDTAISEGLEIGEAIGYDRGVEDGVKEGIKEGIKEGKLSVAKSMKLAGIAMEIIVQVTGLSETEIAELK
jgi:predicted transposase/invertase (TIGR01784 family)